MNHQTRFREMSVVAATAAFLLILANASGAAAAIHPGNYFTKSKTASVGDGASGARKVICPTGDRVITGGAYWHRSGQNGDPELVAWVQSTAPTPDGRGWNATGHNEANETLDFTVIAQCLPEHSVGLYTVHSRDVVVDPGRSGNADLKCKSTQKMVMGGGVWHRPGHDPDPTLMARVTGSGPDLDGEGWTVAGRNYGPSALRLRVTAFCVPNSVVPGYVVTSAISAPIPNGPGYWYEHYLVCPSGQRALGGGAWWGYLDTAGEPAIDTEALLLSSSATGDGTSWYASGRQNDPRESYLHFVEHVICMPA